MQYDYEIFMKEHNLDKIIPMTENLASFDMGYYNNEDQADGYFKDEDPITVGVYDLKKSLAEYDYELEEEKNYYVVETTPIDYHLKLKLRNFTKTMMLIHLLWILRLIE